MMIMSLVVQVVFLALLVLLSGMMAAKSEIYAELRYIILWFTIIGYFLTNLRSGIIQGFKRGQ